MTVEARLARLEAAEQIRALKARYCELCDNGYDADKLAALFVEDAVWDGGRQLGRYEGREAILRFFQGMPAMLSFAIHYVSNPFITVSDDAMSGKGSWYLLQTATTSPEGRAMWFAATYEDEYIRVGDSWFFKGVLLKRRFFAPYERGWARSENAA